jgi:hypothetical protein
MTTESRNNEKKEAAVATQRRGKNVFAATNNRSTT